MESNNDLSRSFRELPIPRPPAEIIGGDGFDVWANTAYVYTDNGEDVTETFKAGHNARIKIKSPTNYNLDFERKSPSCGSQLIYDGQFSGIKSWSWSRNCLFYSTRNDRLF